ncbi:MAG: hypothetical protein JNK58_09570 [Phycisphaerae bacterium]|nr:hypothetical protein [Phycisphaerae bacterium]
MNALRLQAASLGVVGLVSCALGSTPSDFSTVTLTEPTSERVGAGLATIDVTGIPSMDLLGSPNNVVILLWIGPFNSVNGIGHDVVLQTLLPESRRRDISLFVRNSANQNLTGFFIQPGSADPTPGGPTAYSSGGITKLADFNIPPVQALADGVIRIEFFESRDEVPNQADAIWVSGTVSLQMALPIPTPVSPGISGFFALAGIAGLHRRRRDVA